MAIQVVPQMSTVDKYKNCVTPVPFGWVIAFV
jgi:hypothetical protein